MRCEECLEQLGELVDGTVSPDGQRALERHLDACPDCRALAADLRTIRAAAFTLERHEPPARVWEALSARLADEPAPGTAGVGAWLPRGTALHTWLAAAAALVIVTAASVLSLLGTPDAPPDAPEPPGLLETVQSELQQAEAHYQKAIDGLEAIAREDTGTLDPQVAAVLQKNLQVIDQAIGESRAALRVQPASAPAQESLFDAMRNKVALLQQTVELINEMRKGNQAETARLVEGLGPT
ncbi:MAG: anti-sigma factor family protein [Vicinamibacteria bacterium]